MEMAPESLTTVGGFSSASHSAWLFCTFWWNQKMLMAAMIRKIIFSRNQMLW